MKKLFTLSFILLLFNAKSYSQTQFPFYGFELSNYEVGDTLEYSTSLAGPQYQYQSWGTTSYIISVKTLIGNDSIKYTVKEISNDTGSSNGHGYNPFNQDTTQSIIITNDTVYDNNNNLVQELLFKYDTLQFTCGSIGCKPDSGYLKFDTLSGLKSLKLLYSSVWDNVGYKAIENIGVTEIYSHTEYNGDVDWSLSLVYAHLANYGIYGAYTKLIDNINQPSVLKDNTSIRYDNGNAYLFLTSPQNLSSPVLTIYDILGRPLKTMQVNTGGNLINLNNFAKGMYLYKVTSNGNVLGQGKLMNL